MALPNSPGVVPPSVPGAGPPGIPSGRGVSPPGGSPPGDVMPQLVEGLKALINMAEQNGITFEAVVQSAMEGVGAGPPGQPPAAGPPPGQPPLPGV